jgi:DNA-binding Lrp family transcriptional regulator
MQAGVPDAAAVQLRRTIEAAAAHFGISERSLVKSIEKLIADGHITKTFGEAMHHVRAVGNVGAHASDEQVDNVTAERALTFTTQLLRNLFEVPAELAALNVVATGEDRPSP